MSRVRRERGRLPRARSGRATSRGLAGEASGGSAGLSFVGDDGYLGLAYSYRDDDYGLPGHSHEFEGMSILMGARSTAAVMTRRRR